MKSTSPPSRWKRLTLCSSTLLLTLAFLIAWISPASAFGSSSNQKVLLQDVRTLTLHRGRMTTGRRTSPVPQLNCIGGNACGDFEPDVVQCHNAGSDGSDVQWKCEADLPNNVRFGQLDVYCEGYKNPDDPYVLKGSCGLEYKLVYTKSYQRQGYSWDDADINNWVKQAKRRSWTETIYFFTWISVVGFIAISFLKKICRPAHPRHDPPPPYRASNHGGGGGGGGGGWGGGGWGGGSGGSGGDNYKPSSSEGYRPGFWSGLGLGLATHLATRDNNRRQHNAGYNYQAPSSSYGSYAGAPATASSSSSSGSSRTATGYGGTRRR
ncbi:Store-operated calcium entry-associated regulatory factor [Mortierella antarctica]|nr:Store-operated calcium entry-associated regulatory factor [Mortierella antarctica]